MSLKEKFDSLHTKYYQNSVVLQRFVKVFSLDVLVRASNFLLLPVYLKLMSKEEFGLFTYLYLLIQIFSLILNFGLYLSQTKLYHDYNVEERKSLLFTINVLLISGLTLILVPTYFLKLDVTIIHLLITNPINYESYRLPLFLALIVSVYSMMLYTYFITSENVKRYQLYNLVKLVIVNGAVIYLLVTSDIDSVMIRIAYGYLFELAILIIFSFVYFKNMKPVFNKAMAMKAIKIGAPAMITSLVGLIYNFSDKFILEKFGTFSDLAVYNLGFTIAGIILVIFTSFQTVYLPFFFKEKDLIKNFYKTREIGFKMSAIFIALAVGIFLLVKLLFEINIIDMKYGSVLLILPIMLASQIFQANIQLFSNFITYFEVVYVGTLIVFIFSGVNILFNLYLIPKYGITGAAFSVMLVSLLTFLTYYVYAKYKSKTEAIKIETSK